MIGTVLVLNHCVADASNEKMNFSPPSNELCALSKGLLQLAK
jgi:hypothetical protein